MWQAGWWPNLNPLLYLAYINLRVLRKVESRTTHGVRAESLAMWWHEVTSAALLSHPPSISVQDMD